MVSMGIPVAAERDPMESRPSLASGAEPRGGIGKKLVEPAPGRPGTDSAGLRGSVAAFDGFPAEQTIGRGETHQGVDHRSQSVFVAKAAGPGNGRHQINVGQSDEAPVEAAYNEQGGGDAIERFHSDNSRALEGSPEPGRDRPDPGIGGSELGLVAQEIG